MQVRLWHNVLTIGSDITFSEKRSKRKAQDIPPPSRHHEAVETFKIVVSNLAQIASASQFSAPMLALMPDTGGSCTTLASATSTDCTRRNRQYASVKADYSCLFGREGVSMCHVIVPDAFEGARPTLLFPTVGFY